MLASLWLHAHQKKLWCAVHQSCLLFSLSSHSVTHSLYLSLSLFPISSFPKEASIVRAFPMEAMSACLFGPSVFEAWLLQLLLAVLLWLGEPESGQMFVFLILLSGVDLRIWEAALIVFPVCSSGAVMILIEGKWKIQNRAREYKKSSHDAFPCCSDEDQTLDLLYLYFLF